MKRIVYVLLSIFILCGTAYAADNKTSGTMLWKTVTFDAPKLISLHNSDEDIEGAKAAMKKCMLEFRDSVNIVDYHIHKDSFSAVLEELLNSSPELFYVSLSYGVLISDYDNTIIEAVFSYRLNEDQVAERMVLINEECAKIINELSPEMSDVDKALAVHDYFALNYEYNTPASISGYGYYPQAYGIDGLFVDKTAVCQGFTLGYNYILSMLGIDCEFVSSVSMGHAWSLVELDNAWYHVDVTSDTTRSNLGGWAYHTCFLLSDTAIKSQNHYGWSASHTATSRTYDNAFWKSVTSGIFYKDGYWYYSSFNQSNNVICKRNAVSGNTTIIVENIGVWRYSTDGKNFYQRQGVSKLFLNGSKIYYTTPTEIQSVNLDGSNKKTVLKPSLSGNYTYLYGLVKNGNKGVYNVYKYLYEGVKPDFYYDYSGEFDISQEQKPKKVTVLPYRDGRITVVLSDSMTSGSIIVAGFDVEKRFCFPLEHVRIDESRLYNFDVTEPAAATVKVMIWDGMKPLEKPQLVEVY